jgi:heme-degrading monooxygenase HmoA
MTTGISIVLIHWKIKKGREPEFEQAWKTKFLIENRDGLIGEYLSKVERRDPPTRI